MSADEKTATHHPYVVLVGDVGTGKSTLVEKLADAEGQSSDAAVSHTRTTMFFWSKDNKMLIADTPGANSMADKVEHNTQIAAAFNHQPVSKVLIVVKAETRIDNVVGNARKYMEQFLDLDTDVFGVIVTHMDVVEWSKTDFERLLAAELGVTEVVYSSDGSDGETLQNDISGICKTKFNLSVSGGDFYKLFKIHDNKVKILKSAKKQVDLFKEIKRSFDEQRRQIAANDKALDADLLFEFQTFMTNMITDSQKVVSDENNFTFTGEGAPNEVGHLANMTNQLRAILYDIRIETLQQATNDHGVNDLRKCPHCGLVWALIAGCDGDTSCGELVNQMDAKHEGVMATFKFNVALVGDTLQRLTIQKSGKKERMDKTRNTQYKWGCGKTIAWKTMAPVSVPSEFCETVAVTTDDIKIEDKSAREVIARTGDAIEQATKKIQVYKKN